MAAKTEHECFPQPKDKKALVWRHMDFIKFFSLIATQKLFLPRSDKFGDVFEGSYPKADIVKRSKEFEDMIGRHDSNIDTITDGQSAFAKYWRRMIYISCWHMNDYESAAMWGLYTKSNEAIAIQTTYENLVNALPATVFMGYVKYIDYEKDYFRVNNPFYPFMHKRKSFAHDNEVRIIRQESSIIKNGELCFDKSDKDGISVDVNLGSLIEKIYVAPKASAWYRDLVEEVLKKYAINKKPHLSDLDKDPLY